MAEAARAVDMLVALFKGVEGDVYLCSLPNERGGKPGERALRLPVPRHPDEVMRFVEKWDKPGRGLFFCIGTLQPDAKPSARGSYRLKANVHRLPALALDIDFDKLALVDNVQLAVIRTLETCQRPPDIIILSGGGVHAYWRLVQAIEPEEFGRAEALMRGLARRFGGDAAIADVAHLMRLPGTTNSKRGDERPVLFAKKAGIFDRATLKQLEQMVAGEPAGLSRKQYDNLREAGVTPLVVAGNGPTDPFEAYAADAWKAPVDVEQRLGAMRYQGTGDTGVHVTQLAVTASMLNAGVPPAEVVDLVLAKTQAIAPANWDWQRETRELENMCRTWLEKHPPGTSGTTGTNVLPVPPPRVNGGEHRAQPAPVPFPALLNYSTGRDLERRQWLYGRHYIKQFVSCTVGLSGAGKSSLAITEAVAMASSQSLLDVPCDQALKVWYHNAEDPLIELQRRFAAVVKQHDIRREEISGRLFVTSGRDHRLIVAGMTLSKPVRNEKLIAAIKKGILDNHIDVLIIDPLAGCHEVEENSNLAMNYVATIFAEIARDCNCAVELLHHSRKTGGRDVEIEDARGASALIAASRVARTVNVMTDEEADRLAVQERRRHFRLDSGKTSMTPPVDQADWFQLLSVPLGNGDPENAEDEGDQVGVVTRWDTGDIFAGITPGMVENAIAALRQAGPQRRDVQSPQWIGHTIAAALGLSSSSADDQHRLVLIAERWRKNGVLRIVKQKDEKRRWRQFLEVVP